MIDILDMVGPFEILVFYVGAPLLAFGVGYVVGNLKVSAYLVPSLPSYQGFEEDELEINPEIKRLHDDLDYDPAYSDLTGNVYNPYFYENESQ